ncbi:MAG: flgI [Phycisphaerales bacterium]|nr:flgI [Phycisphaerales bacterium]
MNRPLRSLLRRRSEWLCGGLACLSFLAGCAQETKPKPVVRYEDVGKKDVPDFMHGTVWEKVDVGNTEPFEVSSFGLVVNLGNTGDSTAPTAVKQFIRKEMIKRGFGSKMMPGLENLPPERVLADKRVAIVQVVGMLPPGVRKGQSFDVVVSCLPKNTTSSLAGGELYLTDLKINGADASNPFGKVNVLAQAKGFIFVNPSYALTRSATPNGTMQRSLRTGVIMDGGVASFDRPLLLRIRQPDKRVARGIEQRLIERFQDTTIASAQDEGIIELFVPPGYRGDWQHFAKLATHVYSDSTPEVLAARAKMLVAEANKPNAMLDDISYCWEGIGPAALPYLSPLMTDKRPEIAFAAARAAAFIGDPTGAAHAALLDIARNNSNPFQLNAVQAFASLPASASIDHMLRELLDSDKTLVRIEAYKVLARNNDSALTSRVVTEDPNNQKFVLDIVPSHGPPLIFATRTGLPRIAIIGAMPQIGTPVMFTALDDRLMISSPDVGNTLTIFYRSEAARDADGTYHDAKMIEPVKMLSEPDVAEVVARLGGIANDGEMPLNFNYSQIVAILQKLSEQKKLVAFRDGTYDPATFVLQDPPQVQRIYTAPGIDTGRPQAQDKPPAARSNDPAADAALAAGGKK